MRPRSWRSAVQPPDCFDAAAVAFVSSTGLALWNAMKEGLPGDRLRLVIEGASSRRPVFMLHAGLDLSRNRLDVCLLTEHGELIDHIAAPPDGDGLRGLVRRVAPLGTPVR